MMLASIPSTPSHPKFPEKFGRFTAIVIVQMVILTFGFGFLGAVAYFEYLAPSNSVCELMVNHPGELTMVVTLIATVLSVTAATSVYLLFSPINHSVKGDLFHQPFHVFGQRDTKTSNVEAHFSDSPEHWCCFGRGLSYFETPI